MSAHTVPGLAAAVNRGFVLSFGVSHCQRQRPGPVALRDCL